MLYEMVDAPAVLPQAAGEGSAPGAVGVEAFEMAVVQVVKFFL